MGTGGVIDYHIKVPPKLIMIGKRAARKYRTIVLRGGRGSAKSWTVARFLLFRGCEDKLRILCTREIQNTIKDSVHKLLSDQIESLELSDRYKILRDSIIGTNGTEFIFKGLHRNENDIKSMEGIDYCWVEEAQSISRSSLKTLVPTIRKDGSQIFYTYNPTNDDDPVHVDYTLTERPDVLNIEINYDDNKYFPEVLRAEMEWDRLHDIDKYYHVWMGQTVKHSHAQVFFGKWAIDEFTAPEKPGMIFYLGADWGFSIDPSVLLRCYIDERNLYVDYEAYGVGIDIDKLPALFETIPESKRYGTIADSARPETISYMQQHGFPIMKAAQKGTGSVEDGITFLRSFEKIIIHPRCKHTIDEMRCYTYVVDQKTDEVTRKLIDKHNHCIDALRYAVEDLMRDRYSKPPNKIKHTEKTRSKVRELPGW